MKFEKLKLLYSFVEEFGNEVILEIQNYNPPFKLVKYESFDDKDFRNARSSLNYWLDKRGFDESAFVIFEPGFENVTSFIVTDDSEKIYLLTGKSGPKWEIKILADDIVQFLKKGKISFKNLPTVSEILKREAYGMIYLDERYAKDDFGRVMAQAVKESKSELMFSYKPVQTEGGFIHNFECKKNGKEGVIEINSNNESFSDYLESKINSFLKEEMNCNFKFVVVHENAWDNRAKIVFVDSFELEKLKEGNLILEELYLTID